MKNNLQRQGENRLTRALLICFLLFFVILSVLPFAYMAIISFMEGSGTMRLTIDTLKNATWSFENYKKVFVANNFGVYLINSVVVAAIACAMSCLFSTMAAYAFAKKRFLGRDKLHFFYMMTMMIPGVVMIIPMYLIVRKMGLMNTHLAVAIPSAAGAFGTTMMYSFMKNVPDELLEAADIDGCGEIRKFVSIVMPLVKSAIISLAIFVFINSWGGLLWPLLTTTKMELSTVTTALARMSGGDLATNYGYVMAGATLSFLPPFILYVFLQRQFVEGIALSGTKS